jgi:hypothetical protein
MARLMGETTYRGKRCRSCGCTERYVKSGSCTGCTKESAERMREIERAAKKRKRRSSPPEIDAEMNDLLGLNANSSMIENADTLPPICPEHSDPVEDTSESDNRSADTPRNVHGGGSIIPIESSDRTGTIHRVEIGKSGEGSDLSSDSAAEPMASPAQDFVSPELVTTRYWCHPESGCVWTTPGTDSESDGLVEEVSAEAYADLVAAGFIINHEDDLSDIL